MCGQCCICRLLISVSKQLCVGCSGIWSVSIGFSSLHVIFFLFYDFFFFFFFVGGRGMVVGLAQVDARSVAPR